MAEEIVDAYLNHPPYYGKSDYRQLAAVKQLCGPARCFDPTRKLWGTSCTEALQYLVASKKWEPVGVPSDLHAALVRAAREHGFWNEADYVAGVEEGEAAKRKQASALPTPGARPRKGAAVAPALASASAPAPAPAPAACVAATVGGSGANGRRNADGGGSDAGTDEAGSCGSPASSDASLGGAAALGADSLRTTSPPIALSEGEELMRRGHLG